MASRRRAARRQASGRRAVGHEKLTRPFYFNLSNKRYCYYSMHFGVRLVPDYRRLTGVLHIKSGLAGAGSWHSPSALQITGTRFAALIDVSAVFGRPRQRAARTNGRHVSDGRISYVNCHFFALVAPRFRGDSHWSDGFANNGCHKPTS